MLQGLASSIAAQLAKDSRVIGVLVAGSLAEGRSDRFSDVDLVVVSNTPDHADVLAECRKIAGRLGELVAAFTGEHVGEPRLLICLYGTDANDGVVHVDLKFVTPTDLTNRVDEPRILYDPTGVCAGILSQSSAHWPERAPQWFEDRTWIWLHYGAARLGRGELLEAVSTLDWLRSQVLGPMAARNAGQPQRSLRRLEEAAPVEAAELWKTTSTPDAQSIWLAYKQAVALYLSWRAVYPPDDFNRRAETLVTTYIDHLRNELT